MAAEIPLPTGSRVSAILKRYHDRGFSPTCSVVFGQGPRYHEGRVCKLDMDSLRVSLAPRILGAGVLAIVIGFAALYCRAVAPYWKLTPDSTTYVLGAQSLAHGEGYKEDGAPATLFPPGTSVLLAAGWIAGGGSYRVLNAEVVLAAFASLAILFLLWRDSLGAWGSAAVALLCLGSAEFFYQSTFLLSEMFFLFFSLLALWLHRRDSTPGAVLAALAAVMVRAVGVTLAAALLLDCLRRRPRRWAQAAGYCLPLLFAVLWELRNRRLGWSYTELITENEPWVKESGHASLGALFSRLAGNLTYGRAVEDLLSNGWTQHLAWAIIPGLIMVFLLVLGCYRLAARGQSAAVIYSVLFGIAVGLDWPTVIVRLMVPLLPVLFAFLVGGVAELGERIGSKWIFVPAALALGMYLVRGFREERAIAAEDRASPFTSNVRYSGSDDMQRLALWWKDHAPESDLYACQHPNVIGIITGRRGVNTPSTQQPLALESAMRSRHARSLLLNMNSDAEQELARILEGSARFRLTRQEKKARLYELADWDAAR